MELFRRLLSAPLLALLWLYQKVCRPLMPPMCRFYPSCSDYAVEAVKVHGPFKGSWMAAKRVGRCNPLCEGGFDPVPGGEGSSLLEQPAPESTAHKHDAACDHAH